jgi:hypothetical protein
MKRKSKRKKRKRKRRKRRKKINQKNRRRVLRTKRVSLKPNLRQMVQRISTIVRACLRRKTIQSHH